jgi:hypothetical protein
MLIRIDVLCGDSEQEGGSMAHVVRWKGSIRILGEDRSQCSESIGVRANKIKVLIENILLGGVMIN